MAIADSAAAQLPATAQWYPQKRYSVLPGPLARDPLEPSYHAHNPHTGELIAPLDPSKPFVAYHRDFLRLLGADPSLEVIASNEDEGYPLFHEAGIWIAETQEVFFTSNCNPQFRNQIGKLRLDALEPAGGSRTTSSSWDLISPQPAADAQETVVASNGGIRWGDQLLFCCQGTDDVPSSLSVVSPFPPYESRPILNNYHGRLFNAINDVAILPPFPHPTSDLSQHAVEGATIWFTDPTYNYMQRSPGYRNHPPQMPNQVYCFDPNSGEVRCVADGFAMPNGICFNHEGSLCYITDTGLIKGDGSLDPQRPASIYVYDVVRPDPAKGEDQHCGPRLENRRVFAYCDAGVPDGIKTDKAGNVYSGTGEGVSIWNAHGTLLGKILLPPPALPASLPHPRAPKTRYCANFCLCPGGRVCILAEDRIYVAKLADGVEGSLLP
ncbi:SMP-30/gluconolactonase/LRE family protein [Rhodotorula paludigena]|uniref:SMP-30/gluconolactonase/LRE family protein n=1 Tax=Rhodotorula paludigena TaxID=86838 RepID=UPI00317DCE8C